MPAKTASAKSGRASAGPGPVNAIYSAVVAPFVNFLAWNFPLGPKLLQARHIINLQKGGTLPFCVYLMHRFDAWESPTMQIYTALHGSYGILWVLKDYWFPDKRWEVRLTPVSIFCVGAFLILYWAAPFIIATSSAADLEKAFALKIAGASAGVSLSASARRAICTFVYVIGVGMMLVADCQKYYALKYNREKARKKQFLVDDGIFWNNRNPNYLGEMLLYGSFAALVPITGGRTLGSTGIALGYLPWMVLAFIWGVVFMSNMYTKEDSLRKKPGWEAYRRRSWLLFPRLTISDMLQLDREREKVV